MTKTSMQELEEQTSWDGQWDEEKVQRLKIALTASRMYCEEDGEEDEESKDQSKLSCNAS